MIALWLPVPVVTALCLMGVAICLYLVVLFIVLKGIDE